MRFNKIGTLEWIEYFDKHKTTYSIYSDGKRLLYLSNNGYSEIYYSCPEHNYQNFKVMYDDMKYKYKFHCTNEDYEYLFEKLKKISEPETALQES